MRGYIFGLLPDSVARKDRKRFRRQNIKWFFQKQVARAIEFKASGDDIDQCLDHILEEVPDGYFGLLNIILSLNTFQGVLAITFGGVW